VVPIKTTDWRQLLAIQNALEEGVFAIADAKRPEFFEIEIEDEWYYIHIPSQIAGVYLVAVRRTSSPIAKVQRSTNLESATVDPSLTLGCSA
jgi:hypothetical protein